MKKTLPDKAILIPDTAKLVFKGVTYDVYHWSQKLYDGSFTTFEMLKRVDTAVIIGVKDDKLVIIDEQQAHHPMNRHFPTGRVDAGENWQTAAAREMHEEAGLSFKNWRLVHVVQPFDQVEWFVAVFLATECTDEGERHLEAGEKSTMLQFDFADVKAQMEAGRDDLKHSRDLFDPLTTLQDLLALAEFQGRVVDR